MFTLFCVILSFALLNFGAVLPSAWLLIELIWIVGLAVYVIVRAQRESLTLTLVIFLLSSLLLLYLVPPRFAIGLVAAPWAYIASRGELGSRRTMTFLRFLLVIGLLEAILGLIQFLVSPGWIFGYINPFYKTSGTLINRNHFAGLLEMLIPASLGLAYATLQRSRDLGRAYMYSLAGGVMALALVFSLSRMGIFSFLLTLLFLGLILRMKAETRLPALLGFGALGLTLVGALWVGIDAIVERYGELFTEDTVSSAGRLLVFSDTARMIRANPLGIGVGNYEDRMRAYQTYRLDLKFDHAHNDYLETAAEWGVPIAIAFWLFVFAVLICAVREFFSTDSFDTRGILLACIGAIFSILVHSLMDFNLQIPSNALLFFSFVGVATSLCFENLRIKASQGWTAK